MAYVYIMVMFGMLQQLNMVLRGHKVKFNEMNEHGYNSKIK